MIKPGRHSPDIRRMDIAFRRGPLAFGAWVLTCAGVFVVGLVGCAHLQPPAAAETPDTVGTLAPSYNSIAVAPVHATTDFGHAEIVQAGDDGRAPPSPAEVVVAPVAPGPDASQPRAEMAVAPVARGVDASQPPVETETPNVIAKSSHGF
jgi:hypothetical protein